MVLVSASQFGFTRIRAAATTTLVVVIGRNFSRSASGAATRIAPIWCSAPVAAASAERRAASSTESIVRSPVDRGSPSSGRASASRAERTASRGSDFFPPRRSLRVGRSSSTTRSPCVRRNRVSPAP